MWAMATFWPVLTPFRTTAVPSTCLSEYFQPLQCFLAFLAYPSFFLFLLLFLFVSLLHWNTSKGALECAKKQLPDSPRLLFGTHYLYAVMLLEAFSALFCLLQSLPMACFTLILGQEQNSCNSHSVHISCAPAVPSTPDHRPLNSNYSWVLSSAKKDG